MPSNRQHVQANPDASHDVAMPEAHAAQAMNPGIMAAGSQAIRVDAGASSDMHIKHAANDSQGAVKTENAQMDAAVPQPEELLETVGSTSSVLLILFLALICLFQKRTLLACVWERVDFVSGPIPLGFDSAWLVDTWTTCEV
jgi:hypothetical protein